jgi:hypothetical protein
LPDPLTGHAVELADLLQAQAAQIALVHVLGSRALLGDVAQLVVIGRLH